MQDSTRILITLTMVIKTKTRELSRVATRPAIFLVLQNCGLGLAVSFIGAFNYKINTTVDI